MARSLNAYSRIASCCTSLMLLVQGFTFSIPHALASSEQRKPMPTLATKNCAALFQKAIPEQQPEVIARLRENGIKPPAEAETANGKGVSINFNPVDKIYRGIDDPNNKKIILSILNHTFGPYGFYFQETDKKPHLYIGLMTDDEAKTMGGILYERFFFNWVKPRRYP